MTGNGSTSETLTDLASVEAFLGDLHQATAWDWSVRTCTSSHCAWEAQIEIITEPYPVGAGHHHIFTARGAATPEAAILKACSALAAWLPEAPAPASRPCWDCERQTT